MVGNSLEDKSNFETFLEKEGFDILDFGGLCPFQVSANHNSGISIYFRARGCRCTLYIYGDPQYIDLPEEKYLIGSSYFDCWDFPQAGHLSWGEAFYVFHSLWSDAKDKI